MRQYIDSFLSYLSVERDVSLHTSQAYRSDIIQFLDFLKENSITPKQISLFSRNLYEKAFHSRSISRKLSSVKQFCRYLTREGVLDVSLDSLIVKPKLPTVLPKVLSQVDVARLLMAPGDADSFPYRDRAILEVFYGCGLRISEIPGIATGHIKEAHSFIKVLGKRNKERLVPLGQYARNAIDAYKSIERPDLLPETDSEWLFLNQRGGQMGRQSLYNLVKKYVHKAGLPLYVTPHTLRHSFATHLLEGEAGVREVQELLGHDNISTTQIYTHVSKDHLRSHYDQYHPRR